MSSDPATDDPYGQPSEQDRSEIDQRAAYEAEMQRVSSMDLLLQATVSLLNVGGYRLGLGVPAGEAGQGAGEPVRDLEQVRDAIDAVRALLPIIERRHPQELRPLRDALSQLQMAYAREAGAQSPPRQAGAEAQQQQQSPPGQAGAEAQQQQQSPPGQAGAEAQQQSPPGAPAADTAQDQAAQQPKSQEPGPAEASGRLWVPGR